MTDDYTNNPENLESDDDLNALEEGDIIEMIDDNGETVPFVFIDAIEYEGCVYLALAEPEEDDAVFFLRYEQDEEGNDIYTAPDESLEDALFEQFSKDHPTDGE